MRAKASWPIVRVVPRLNHVGEAFGAKPLQFLVRERGPERHVGHDRQGLGEAGHRHVQTDGGAVAPAVGQQIRAQEVDGVGDLERRSRTGALEKHGRREVGDAELAGGVVTAAAQHDEVRLHDRDFVKLHDPHGQAVRELALLDSRKLQRRRRTGLRSLTAIGRLRADGERREDGGGNDCQGVTHGYFAPSGTTVSSTRASFGRNLRAAARMSVGDSAR